MSELPKIKIGDKVYFVDKKLEELRNISNPHETMSFEAYCETVECQEDCMIDQKYL
jgi:hypothetical protein